MRTRQYKQIQKLQYGDRKVYRQLCEKHFKQFLNYALKGLKSPGLAEVVLKDTLLDVWENRHRLDPNLAFNVQIFEVLEKRVFEMLHKMVDDEELGHQIRDFIRQKLDIPSKILLDKDRASVIDAIHNELLQQQLLHELATTRR